MTAKRLPHLHPEAFRMGLQADHDLQQAQLKLGRQLERIARVAA